jgi:hypothetical protein
VVFWLRPVRHASLRASSLGLYVPAPAGDRPAGLRHGRSTAVAVVGVLAATLGGVRGWKICPCPEMRRPLRSAHFHTCLGLHRVSSCGDWISNGLSSRRGVLAATLGGVRGWKICPCPEMRRPLRSAHFHTRLGLHRVSSCRDRISNGLISRRGVLAATLGGVRRWEICPCPEMRRPLRSAHFHTRLGLHRVSLCGDRISNGLSSRRRSSRPYARRSAQMEKLPCPKIRVFNAQPHQRSKRHIA